MDLLGHPTEPDALARRLLELERLDPDGFRRVADAGGRAVGFVAAHLTPMLHRERPVGRVTTLVVEAGRQGSGVGTLLLAAAEEWLAAKGAVRLELTSGDGRLDAHRFYERRGWRREGVRYVREREP
jgi:GNAT superfamily N-acetyltransferase